MGKPGPPKPNFIYFENRNPAYFILFAKIQTQDPVIIPHALEPES